MALSKPTDLMLNLTVAYFQRLYSSPVKTKAITSSIIAALSNYLTQKISGQKYINEDTLRAFALFGLFFGGPVPHYFYQYIRPYVRSPLMLLLVERCLYTPCFLVLSIYALALFQGKTSKDASKQLKQEYWHLLSTNLKYFTLLQYINFKYVPPMLRVLMINLIDLLWRVYVQYRARAKRARK